MIACSFNQRIGIKHVYTVTGGNGPVVVLTRSVDFVEGLFLQKGSKTLLGRNFFDNLHDHKILVNLCCVGSVKGSKFELVGGNFTMTSLQWNTNSPAFILDFLHAGQGSSRCGERGHVVITHLLATRGILSDKSTSTQLKIRATVVVITLDKEKFLFKTNVCDNSRTAVKTKVGHEASSLLVKSSVCTKKRCFLIKCSTVVRNKHGRNKDGVSTKENRRRSVNSEVTSSSVCSTKATVGI
mmetsp:Transcript_7228/g.9413  ORF Transcript_7228/g.9413 Transcript_7228/m.9413 type:complete len:240 (-) Transcript_7228:468-1187(-)